MFLQTKPGTKLTNAAVVGSVLTVAAGCAHRGEVIADYGFSIVGTVSGPAGEPLEGVEVLLEVGEAVYEGIRPVDEREYRTDESGRFAIWFLTHNPATPYVLRFVKGGFAPGSITGTSPPYQYHSITLQRAQGPALEDRDEVPPEARMLPNKEMQRTRPGFAWSLAADLSVGPTLSR